jgi:hypothetical protein
MLYVPSMDWWISPKSQYHRPDQKSARMDKSIYAFRRVLCTKFCKNG